MQCRAKFDQPSPQPGDDLYRGAKLANGGGQLLALHKGHGDRRRAALRLPAEDRPQPDRGQARDIASSLKSSKFSTPLVGGRTKDSALPAGGVCRRKAVTQRLPAMTYRLKHDIRIIHHGRDSLVIDNLQHDPGDATQAGKEPQQAQHNPPCRPIHRIPHCGYPPLERIFCSFLP